MTDASAVVPNESMDEQREALREYLRLHPGTRLIDLKAFTDPVRGPLFILAKRMLERGELFEHPRTKALYFHGMSVNVERKELEPPAEVLVKILKDVPPFKDSDGIDRRLRVQDVVTLPGSFAKALMIKGMAEEVSASKPEPCIVPTAAPESSPIVKDDAPLEVVPYPIETNIEVLDVVPNSTFLEERYRFNITYSDGSKKVIGYDGIISLWGHIFWREKALPLIREYEAAHPSPTDPLTDSLDRFRKKAREEGEEAAVAAKKAEEAPRVEAREREKEALVKEDCEALRNGSWWEVVDKAINEFLAGEPLLRKVVIYSALSTGLKDSHIHLTAQGDSQTGKSYAFRSIGSKLFPGIFIDIASMSGKAMFYAAKDAENPRLFDGKIMMIDELADQSETTLDFLKAGMSPGAKKLTNLTVDEHKKASNQNLEGMPVFWSTAAEPIEDAEGQIMNRPFIVNPDESPDQTRKVLEFQREAASVKLIENIRSEIPRAQRLLERILEEKDFIIYNLFVDHIKISEVDAKARNTLPMFFNLVAAITYAHRFGRQVIELPGGRKILFASYMDNLEAAELWGWGSVSRSTHLPPRHIELLKLLPNFAGDLTGGFNLDTLRQMYMKATGRTVSHKTVLNYLVALSSKDKATYYETDEGEHLWYSTGSPHTFPTASQLLIGMESAEGKKLLDEQLKSLKKALSQLPNEIRLIEGFGEKVVDIPLNG
jgi:hypothetical protein